MRFEWDEAKRLSNLVKHGIAFADLTPMCNGRHRLDFESPRGGEHRTLSIALLDGRLIAVAWMWRGAEVIRLISARRARDEEKWRYGQLYC